LLPYPDEGTMAWQIPFETELFDFPSGATADQVDAFSQGVLAISQWIETGWRARMARAQEVEDERLIQQASIVTTRQMVQTAQKTPVGRLHQ
jgi:hypothetical protein